MGRKGFPLVLPRPLCEIQRGRCVAWTLEHTRQKPAPSAALASPCIKSSTEPTQSWLFHVKKQHTQTNNHSAYTHKKHVGVQKARKIPSYLSRLRETLKGVKHERRQIVAIHRQYPSDGILGLASAVTGFGMSDFRF